MPTSWTTLKRLGSQRQALRSSTRSDHSHAWSPCPTLQPLTVARSTPRHLPAKMATLSKKTSHDCNPFPCAPGVDGCGSSLCAAHSAPGQRPLQLVDLVSPAGPRLVLCGGSWSSLIPFADTAPPQLAAPIPTFTCAPKLPVARPVHAASLSHWQGLFTLLPSAVTPTVLSF